MLKIFKLNLAKIKQEADGSVVKFCRKYNIRRNDLYNLNYKIKHNSQKQSDLASWLIDKKLAKWGRPTKNLKSKKPTNTELS